MLNKNFYPTPLTLAVEMLSKIKSKPQRILEPSAGKGDLIQALKKSYKFQYADISAIEIDETLQATLRGQGVKVIDSDFLSFSAPDKFDAIVMNPPFDAGAEHLHKALDILYRGEIVCLLNAETLKNPFSNSRKTLTERLEALGADIKYIQNAFIDSERRTGVEVALVYVNIERKIEDDLFEDCEESNYRQNAEVQEQFEVSTGRTVFELVADYERTVEAGQKAVVDFYRQYKKIGGFLRIGHESDRGDKYYSPSGDLTTRMQDTINTFLADVRVNFWRKVLDLKEVKSRLTQKKAAEFEIAIQERSRMDFTENNVRQFVLNLIGGYEQTLTEAVLEQFEIMTQKHSWDDKNTHEKNIHYFNGWKTNRAFKVGKKVIIPIGYVRSGGQGPFTNWGGNWKLDYDAQRKLQDIDIVMNYFGGMEKAVTISEALKWSFEQGENKATSTYFQITANKKGTIHLTFLDDDILRRFNVVACKGKNWLPGDFGAKPYDAMSQEEKSVVEAFEGKQSYSKNVNRSLFSQTVLQIGN